MNNDSSIANLSVCMVAHNEEQNIGQALESVAGWASEIVVIDAGSTDRTAEIAASFGARVIPHPNQMNIEGMKNVSFAAATLEWVFLLDPDEAVPDGLKREIADLLRASPRENGFKLPRRNFYFGVPLMHGGNYPDKQLRLFRRGAGEFPADRWHERVTIDGSVGELNNYFDHFPYPTFEVWIEKFLRYTAYEASILSRENVPINAATIRRRMIIRPMRRWLSRLFLKRGIRDGVPGVLAATFDLMTHVVGFGRYWMK